MRQRPLCIAFLSLIAFIIIMKTSGFYLWGEPDKALRTLVSGLEGENCIISGVVASREEKENSISYFIKGSYLIKNISFKEACSTSAEGSEKVPLNNIRLYTSKEDSRLTIGSKIVIYGEPELYENAKNPGGFDAADYYAADNCCIFMYAEHYKVTEIPEFSPGELITSVREKLRDNLNTVMGESNASALCAMLLGDKTEITDETRLNYSVSGLLHLLAVSGMHVAIIGGGAKKLLLFIRLKQAPASIIAAVAACVYCVFTGAGDSSIRAAIMFTVLQLATVFLRSYDSISALSFAGIIMLMIRPMALFRSGFQLSFAAAAAISCVSPVLKKSLIRKKEASKIKKTLMDAAVVWLSVNLMTFPIVLYHFSEFPTYSIFANMLFVPLMGIIMPFGFAGAVASLFSMPIAKLLLFLPGIITAGIDIVGDLISKLPFSVFISGKPAVWQSLTSFAGALMIILILRNGMESRKKGDTSELFEIGTFSYRRLLFHVRVHPRRVMMLAAIGIFILAPIIRLPEGFSITSLDVGQGDCAVINDGGKVFIIDGGSSSESEVGRRVILPYLKAQGIRRVETVFVTHNDDDHIGGVIELLEMISEKETAVRVEHVVMPYWMKQTDVGSQIEELSALAKAETIYFKTGDRLKNGELVMRTISPGKVENVEDGNENSLVLSIEYNGFKALFTGDIGFEREEELAGKFGEYDYLKVAHHGSKNSSGEEFLKEISPTLCIISAPKNSTYGHPDAATLKRIEESGAHWLQTGLCGAIKTEIKNGKMAVSSYCKTEDQ